MEWNFFNSLIFSTTIGLILFCLSYFAIKRTHRTTRLMIWFIMLSNVVILQVILIDVGLTKIFPELLLLYTPFQFLCPVLFVAFTYSYLNQYDIFKRFRPIYSLPFVCFFVLYVMLKINVVQEYALISKKWAVWIGTELDENSALAFSLFSAIWNYKVIQRYEEKSGSLPYAMVIKKTKWLKHIFITMVLLCIAWALVIAYLKMNPLVSGHGPYYPLWLLFIGFYIIFFIKGSKHLSEVHQKRNAERQLFHKINADFKGSGLHKIFNSHELLSMQESRYQATEILEYFATSLFDKHTETEVLWDVAKNCISKLGLEDCVIYSYDSKSGKLIQKAAFGNKDNGNRKIVSPIEIPLGKGIVGAVAKSKQWEVVNNMEIDNRYIVDDLRRQSELAVPILFEDSLIGVLDSENSEKDFFTEKHIFLFQLIAKLVSIKLVQIRKKTGPVLTDDNIYYTRFKQWLEEEKVFLDVNLSLQTSSDHLSISPGYLSHIINTLGGVNFSEFINLYRIDEAKRLLVHPHYSNYTIVAVGLESGFNSKSAFYNAFKKHLGETPSEYRQRYKMVS